jgi:acylphosphatase
MQRLHGIVRGDVQGVGFRFFLIRRARELRLTGWVTNRDDGAVEFIAEGNRGDLEDLERAARSGPRQARVTDVELNWSRADGGLDTFDIT